MSTKNEPNKVVQGQLVHFIPDLVVIHQRPDFDPDAPPLLTLDLQNRGGSVFIDAIEIPDGKHNQELPVYFSDEIRIEFTEYDDVNEDWPVKLYLRDILGNTYCYTLVYGADGFFKIIDGQLNKQ